MNKTYIAPKGSFYDGNVKIKGNFIVPSDIHFWGDLVVEGSLQLGAGSSVGGSVICESVVIGRSVKIKGSVRALKEITISDNVSIGSVKAGGDIIIRPGVKVGDVRSEGTIYIYGKIISERLTGRNVKVLGH